MIKLKKIQRMKKILLLLFALIPVLPSLAQTNWSNQPESYNQYWMIGARYGFSQFHGDLSTKGLFSMISSESKSSLGISLSRQISPVFSIKADYSRSNYYGKNRLHWQDSVNYTNLTLTGNTTEIGVYGTVNLNKLINKNEGDNWNVYFSSGIGLTNWRCKLKDDNNVTLAQLGYADNKKTRRYVALSVPLTFGASVQLTDGIWLSVEHAIHIVFSDTMDAYENKHGYNDFYSTSTIGITMKLQKLAFFHFKRNVENTTTVSASQPRPDKSLRRSVRKGMSKSQPELQEYTGYNGLLPPPSPKTDTTKKDNPIVDQNKDNWISAVDSGRFEITGGQKNVNANMEVLTGKNKLTRKEAQTGLVPVYRVQIQASKVYIPVNDVLKKRELTDTISVELRSDGWYRYYVGQYSSLKEANAKLVELQAKGVKDAFIVSFKTSVRKVVNVK